MLSGCKEIVTVQDGTQIEDVGGYLVRGDNIMLIGEIETEV